MISALVPTHAHAYIHGHGGHACTLVYKQREPLLRLFSDAVLAVGADDHYQAEREDHKGIKAAERAPGPAERSLKQAEKSRGCL